MRFLPVSYFVIEPDAIGGMYVAAGYDRFARRVAVTETPRWTAHEAAQDALRLWPRATLVR